MWKAWIYIPAFSEWENALIHSELAISCIVILGKFSEFQPGDACLLSILMVFVPMEWLAC